MTRVSSYANRGQDLEDMIQTSNEIYLRQGKALVQKIPTPVKVLNTNSKTGKITGFYEKKSTVDYTGVYQGCSLAFDAKETSVETRFDLNNVGDHQYTYLASHTTNGGISFLIVWFKEQDEMYYLSFELLDQYWQNQFNGGRKSIPYEKIAKEEYQIQSNQVPVDYLSVVEEMINSA